MPCERGVNDWRIRGRGGREALSSSSFKSGDECMHIWGLSENGRFGAMELGAIKPVILRCLLQLL